jgi:hypothetical protein
VAPLPSGPVFPDDINVVPSNRGRGSLRTIVRYGSVGRGRGREIQEWVLLFIGNLPQSVGVG